MYADDLSGQLLDNAVSAIELINRFVG